MGPDPEKISRSDKFDQPDYVINQLDDEMDLDEDNDNNGYIILGQQEDETNNIVDDESDSENDEQVEYFPEESHTDPPNVSLIRSASSELTAAVWNNSSTSSNIEITSEKSKEITQIMSKINLPNAPNWLDEINTENILDRIRNKNQGADSTVKKN